jgi:hypothetical protein
VKKIYLICFGILLFSCLSAQVADSSDVLDSDNETQFAIENLIEDADLQEFDFDTEFERLEIYRKNPLDINNCSKEQLNAFGLLTEIQIQALLNYRKRFGQIFSFYEMQNIPTFDQNIVKRMLPYLTIDMSKDIEQLNFKRAFKYSKNQVFIRYQRILENQDGYTASSPGESPAYSGSPDKLYARYRMTYKDRMSLGITMEKDAGESWLTPFSPKAAIPLPDYFSAHFYLKDVNKYVKALAIGDYQVFFGQGLTMWGGFGVRKGANTLNIKRFSPSLRPYTSVNEALYMRGAAATFEFGKLNKIETTVFASHRFRDANISLADTSDDASLDVLQISSLQESGLHRTTNELADKNSTQFFSTGAEFKYRAENWQIGARLVYNRLSDSLDRDPKLYQKYQFTGLENLMASVDYSYLYKNLQLFGETAVSQNGGIATLNGMLLAMDERLGFSLVQRYYDKKYQSLTGNAFGEGSNINNESGVYVGINSNIANGLNLSGYFDVFSFPWLRSVADAPAKGHEYLLRLDYAPTYKWSVYAQYRFEEKQVNKSENLTPIDYLIFTKRQSLRLNFRYRVNSEFELRSRAEFSFFNDGIENRGFMLYQDFVWSPAFAPLKAHFRIAVFDAVDYDTRIYTYENDLLYSFSVPALSGRGTRFYINLSYRINRNWSVWLKFAQTWYSDRNVISSGTEEILGNTRSEIRAQVRFSF